MRTTTYWKLRQQDNKVGVKLQASHGNLNAIKATILVSTKVSLINRQIVLIENRFHVALRILCPKIGWNVEGLKQEQGKQLTQD